jgi:hypothetical protein
MANRIGCVFEVPTHVLSDNLLKLLESNDFWSQEERHNEGTFYIYGRRDGSRGDAEYQTHLGRLTTNKFPELDEFMRNLDYEAHPEICIQLRYPL